MSAMRKPRKPLTKVVNFEEMEVSLDAIKVHPEMLQVRARTDQKVSSRYAKARATGSKFPPVILFRIDGELYLVDGFHRFDAWLHLGLPTILAVIREGTMEDALLAAIEANGDDKVDRKLNEEDCRHAAVLMIRNEMFREWSDSEIGRRCGLYSGVVKKIRLCLSRDEGIAIPTRVLHFSGGKLSGRTSPYFPGGGVGRPIPHNNGKGSSPNFRMRLGGARVYLGSDPEAAATLYAERLAAHSAEKEAISASFSTTGRFVEWALQRGILLDPIPLAECPIGGCYLPGVAVLPLATADVDEYLAKTSRLLHQRLFRDGLSRLVLVGLPHSQYSVLTRLIEVRDRLGIEVMTPEEFVAEFGPKADGHAGAAPGEPAP